MFKLSKMNVATNCIVGANALNKVHRMTTDWRQSRHTCEWFPILNVDSVPAAFINPEEIDAIVQDWENWPECLDFFTSQNAIKNQHLNYIENNYTAFIEFKDQLYESCIVTWKLHDVLIAIILQYTISAEPPKLQCQKKLIQKKQWATSDDLKLFCTDCTIYPNNEIIKIIDMTDEKKKKHNKTMNHKIAVQQQNCQYKSMEYCWLQDNDLNPNETTNNSDDKDTIMTNK